MRYLTETAPLLALGITALLARLNAGIRRQALYAVLGLPYIPPDADPNAACREAIPNARMLIRSMAPPENMLTRSRIPPWFELNSDANLSGLIPGSGIWLPTR